MTFCNNRMRVRTFSLIGVWLAGFWIAPISAQDARIEGLGFLNNRFRSSVAWGVSLDGRVVVGEAAVRGWLDDDAFYWTRETGMVSIGWAHTSAEGCSADGQVLVGSIIREGYHEAMYWTAQDGLVPMGDLEGGKLGSTAVAVSANGRVAVGPGHSEASGDAAEGAVWRLGRRPRGIGDLPGGYYYSSAADVSANGKIVVGVSYAETEWPAIIWTRRGGMVPIGDLPGGSVYAVARAISPDGRVVVGQGSTGRYGQTFWWTAETGMINLGGLPDTDRQASLPFDVSADGGVVVGNAEHHHYHVDGAAVWDATHGMRSLYRMLRDQFGVDMSSWARLLGAHAVSGDGFTIVGYGERTNRDIEAYRVELPCLEFCDRCSLAEKLSVNCATDEAGRPRVEGVVRHGRPGATVTLCLTDRLYVKNRCKTRTVNADGRATARWLRPAGEGWQVRMKECNVETYVTCP